MKEIHSWSQVYHVCIFCYKKALYANLPLKWNKIKMISNVFQEIMEHFKKQKF